MSKPAIPENEQLSNIDPWEKIERRASLEKKSECPGLMNIVNILMKVLVFQSCSQKELYCYVTMGL